MTSITTYKFILLSELINKMKGNTYYIRYAKSLLSASIKENPLPPDSELVTEMFCYFIRENELNAYYKCSTSHTEYKVFNLNKAQDFVKYRRAGETEIYIKLDELKKLYANKCIVFPKSLLSDKKDLNC